MAALTKLLGNPVLLDRDQEVVVRVYDWSDDSEEPVVNIDFTPARDIVRGQDLVDQVGILLEHHGAEPEHVKAVLDDLAEIGSAGVLPVWKSDPRSGLVFASETIRSELESALATVNAVRDHAARAVWVERSATGATLTEVAAELHLDPAEFAAMIAADRNRTLDL